MSYNDCFGQDSPQLPEQGQQGRFLFQCPCVRGYAAGRQAPFITDADRMPVVVLAVRSDSLQRASAMNPAVARDVEMVTDILETAVVDMVVAAGLEIQVPPLGGGGTMDDDQCYLAHTGRLNTTLYTYDAAYSSCHCNDNFQDGAPSRFSFLIFHKG